MSYITTINRRFITGLVLAVLLLAPFSGPLKAATTTDFKPQTQQEMIAYLQGVLAQLQAQLAAQPAETPGRGNIAVQIGRAHV